MNGKRAKALHKAAQALVSEMTEIAADVTERLYHHPAGGSTASRNHRASKTQFIMGQRFSSVYPDNSVEGQYHRLKKEYKRRSL